MSVIIGTRKSKLALIQAQKVKEGLENNGYECVIRGYTSAGDIDIRTPLYKNRSTGVFVEELNNLVLNNTIDIAVHSGKDIPSNINQNLEISGTLKRDDYRDVMISEIDIASMPAGYIIGTSSYRRIRELKTLNSKIEIRDIRGNIDTRLNKYKNGEYNGIIIAKAAYDRMNLTEQHFTLAEEDFVPAPNQGIIAMVTMKNSEYSDIVKRINNVETYEDFTVERYIVKELNLGCSTPVGILSKNKTVLSRFYSLKSGDYKNIFFYNEDKQKMVQKIREEIRDYGYF